MHIDRTISLHGRRYHYTEWGEATGRPLVELLAENAEITKHLDRAALAVAREPEQVVDMLRYALEGRLP